MSDRTGASVIVGPAADMRRPSSPTQIVPDPNGNRAQRRAWRRKHRDTNHQRTTTDKNGQSSGRSVPDRTSP